MRNSGLTILLAGFLVGTVALWGQQGGQGGQGGGGNTGGNAGGNTGGGGNTGNQTQTQSPNQNQPNLNDPFGNNDLFGAQMRPLYLSGRVVTDDGQPPMEPVVITRMCMGNNYPEGYSDTKGRFGFQVGGDISMLTSDASVSGSQATRGISSPGAAYTDDCMRQVGMGRYDLTSSTLRAELPGYRSDEVQLGIYSAMGENNVGVIVLHRLDGLVGNAVSALTLQAPKKAQNAYFSGLREMQKKTPNFKKGITQFEKAVKAYPQFAAAWAAMGDALVEMNNPQGARDAFEKAIAADPDYLKPYEPLIQMSVKESDWAGLEHYGGEYLKLNPNSGNVQFLTAVAALNTGKPEVAEELVTKIRAGKDTTRLLQTHQIMGMIYEQRTDFQKAAAEYREFVKGAGQSASQNVRDIERKLKEWTMLGVIEGAP